MPKTLSDIVEIAYDDCGTGEPALLLMPGWCINRSAFEDLIPRLSKRRRVLTLDWRGHGDSGDFDVDFGEDELLADALSVIEVSGVNGIVPVALAHAGWIALMLRRRLSVRIPRMIFIDWIVTEPPSQFLQALEAMKSSRLWRKTIDSIFDQWLQGTENRRLVQFVRFEMGSYGFAMWARAAREIAQSYSRYGSPLNALLHPEPQVPVLHIYAQPDDAGYLAAQSEFAAENPWYHVHKLQAKSHFPMFEVPDEMADIIEKFLI